ncbi:MAG: hypothetical protein ACRD3G_20585 [Vicinamibacterales bacterium]
MKPRVWIAALGLLPVVAVASGAGIAPPFAFLEPTVRVSQADRARLDTGGVIARVLPADDGHIAFFAAARLKARPEALIEWTRAIDELKRGSMVLAVGRFSDSIADDDLDALILEPGEIDALRRCRVSGCDFKLAATEIHGLQEALRSAGSEWRDAVQREFRRILIARVRLHRQSGLLALPPYADHGGRMSVGEAFSAMTARSPWLTREFPEVVNSLIAPRRPPRPAGESFYYWSRDRYGSGKTIVTVTYVQLLHADRAPQAMTVSTQLYASHYIDGALGVTAVVCDEAAPSCYLTYLNRTRVDLLGGLFGVFKRAVIEDRVESEGPTLMRDVTRRLESRRPAAEGGES